MKQLTYWWPTVPEWPVYLTVAWHFLLGVYYKKILYELFWNIRRHRTKFIHPGVVHAPRICAPLNGAITLPPLMCHQSVDKYNVTQLLTNQGINSKICNFRRGRSRFIAQPLPYVNHSSLSVRRVSMRLPLPCTTSEHVIGIWMIAQ